MRFECIQADDATLLGWSSFCHGQRPVISSSSEKFRNVLMSTITARTPTLVKVGVPAFLLSIVFL